MKTTGNTILLTGGGSGIGQQLAWRWHDAGNTVIITGRRAAALAGTAAGRPGIHSYALDMTDAAAIRAFAAQVVQDHPALNVLVNNAGIMRLEAIDAPRDLSDSEETVVTNLLGPIRLTDALVGHLAAMPDSAIVNVTSGLAFVPLIRAAVYSATKAALHSYTVSLREALRGQVEVIELAPPAVQTDLTPGQATRPEYLPLQDFIDEVIHLFSQSPTPAEIRVARVAFQRMAEAEGRFDATLRAINQL